MRYKILITRPKMPGDEATSRTFHWAEPSIKEAINLGYEIKDLRIKEANYERVSNELVSYEPHIYIHYGHGCVANIIGQERCVVTNGTLNYDPSNKNYMNDYKYRMGDDTVCDKLCGLPSNVHMIKKKMMVAYACHSAKRLGVCAMKNGARAYIGFNDYLIFMTDNKGTEKIFTEPLHEFLLSMLNGDTLGEAEDKTLSIYDRNIRQNKQYNLIAKLLLWDKKAFTVYGDKRVTIFNNK